MRCLSRMGGGVLQRFAHPLGDVRMRIRGNILLQYTVITFLVTALVTAGLGLVLSRRLTDHLIRAHLDIYPHVIRAMVRESPEFSTFLQAPPGTPPPEEVQSLFNDILSFGGIFRIKLWGPDATVLWSDRAELIGQRFPDNPHLPEAMRGEMSYEISVPGRHEQATEAGRGRFLEVYTPLLQDGKVIGIFELYESAQDLHAQIDHNLRTVLSAIAGAGLLLYTLLFLIFFRAWQRQERTAHHLLQTQEATIFALAYQAELRDPATGQHLERTSRYIRMLAEELRHHPEFGSYLNDEYIADLVRSAPLHDIGKVGISDAILCKPGPLTAAEFEAMKNHSEFGARILEKAEAKLSCRSFFHLARQIALYHHEHWDGSGYPHGLKGEGIPLSARLMGVADVYDTLRSRRYYKESQPHEQSVEAIRSESGKQFDPRVVEAFLRRAENFRSISTELGDAGIAENSGPQPGPPLREGPEGPLRPPA